MSVQEAKEDSRAMSRTRCRGRHIRPDPGLRDLYILVYMAMIGRGGLAISFFDGSRTQIPEKALRFRKNEQKRKENGARRIRLFAGLQRGRTLAPALALAHLNDRTRQLLCICTRIHV